VAKFKDPVYQQIVDDLAVQNPSAPAIPVERIQSLTNLTPDTSGGGNTNTRATLTLTAGSNPPGGSMTIHYRRLSLATLVGNGAPVANFLGVSAQTKTLEDILNKIAPSAVVSYVLPELVAGGPFDLTRSAQPVALTPKADTQILAPDALTVSASTGAVDIGQVLTQATYYPWQASVPQAGEDPKEVMLNRLLSAAGHTEHISASSFLIESLPVTVNVFGGNYRRLRVTVTAPDLYYTGTATFEIGLANIGSEIDPMNIYPLLPYTEGQTLRQALSAALSAQGKYYSDADVEDTALRPVRLSDWTNLDMQHVMGTSTSIVYGGSYSPVQMKATATGLYPFEEIIRFQVDVEGNKRILRTTNTGTMPVTIELQEKPAAFAPSTLDVDANFITTQSLPVGTYKIRITRPDSYRTSVQHRAFGSSDPSEIKVTEVFKVKGHDLSSMFRYCDGITTVYPGAFDESTYTYKAVSLFDGCSNLSTLPSMIFHPMTRCVDWTRALAGTNALRVIPAELFGFLKTYNMQLQQVFDGAGPDTVPSDFIKNARWFNPAAMFSGASKIVSVGSGLFSQADLRSYEQAGRYFRTFYGCSLLSSLPAGLFTGSATVQSPVGSDPYYGYWSLEETFANCVGLTALPADLLQPFTSTAKTLYMKNTFMGCTGLAAIPQGFFDGASFPQTPGLAGTFYGCTALTSVRGDIFRNAQLGNALGFSNSFLSNGLFHNSGLTAIPSDIFVGNETSVRGAQYTFAGTKITTVPANLLAGCTAMEDVLGMFHGCDQLASVPANLFAGAVNLKKATDVFSNCPALTAIPAGLLDAMTQVTAMDAMFSFAGITSLPAGLFANAVALESVTGIFQASQLGGVPNNVFTNQPNLKNVGSAFSSTQITGVGSAVFSGAPNIELASSLFASCGSLASVPANFLAGQTKLTDASFMFSSCPSLPTVPAAIFANAPNLTKVSGLFNACIGLTSIPGALFSGQPGKLDSLFGFASGCTQLAAIPAGLFAGQTAVASADSAFTRCTTLTAVPDNVFSDLTACTSFASAFEKCSGLTTLGNNLVPSSNLTVSLQSMFRGCFALTSVPDGVFFPLKKISSMRFTFMGCYGLTNVGRLVQNTLSTTLEIGGLLGKDVGDAPEAPANYPDVTLADNLIDSTIVVSVGPNGFTKPFESRSALSKNIDNLFGANIRIPFEGNNAVRGWMSGMAITGNGQNFITKHAVPTTNSGFFTGSTNLSDYATLPAWAKA